MRIFMIIMSPLLRAKVRFQIGKSTLYRLKEEENKLKLHDRIKLINHELIKNWHNLRYIISCCIKYLFYSIAERKYSFHVVKKYDHQ
jgi:hypothetical protein